MRYVLLVAIAMSACAHEPDFMRHFPQWDVGWWADANNCPDGAHRVETHQDGERRWECRLPDGTRHGPYVSFSRQLSPSDAGSYTHGVRDVAYMRVDVVGDVEVLIEPDGIESVFGDPHPLYRAEQTLMCPDGWLEMFREDGSLAYRSRFDDGREIGPREPFVDGRPQPLLCVTAAPQYCPEHVDRWIYGNALMDYCGYFKDLRARRQAGGGAIDPTGHGCDSGQETPGQKAAAMACFSREMALNRFALDRGRLATHREAATLSGVDSGAVDPWGHPYAYRPTSRFHFVSAGPDGVFDTRDDISDGSCGADQP